MYKNFFNIYAMKIKNILSILTTNCKNGINDFYFHNYENLKDLIKKINKIKKNPEIDKLIMLPPLLKENIDIKDFDQEVFKCFILLIIKIYLTYQKYIENIEITTDLNLFYGLCDSFYIKICKKINCKIFLSNKRLLKNIRKEIYPILCHIYNSFENEEIIDIEKSECPDFYIYTNKKIYVFELTSVNTKNQIENSSNKINTKLLYESLIKKTENIQKYKNNAYLKLNNKKYKFQIFIVDIYYKMNEQNVKLIINEIIDYIKNKDTKDNLDLTLLDMLQNKNDDTFYFVFWNRKKETLNFKELDF